MTRPTQPTLPLRAPTPRPAPARRETIEMFDFERDGEALVPDPDYVPPEWLRLPGVDD